jgi:transcriptional antiterminator RfaH
VCSKKPTREGPAWITEPLFPGYLFARFPLATSARLVNHAPGVHSIVHFGSQWPSIPDSVLEDLRAHVGRDDLLVIPDAVTPGDQVLISGGVFNNLTAVVTRVMPSRERVEVLLDFLGRQSLAHIPAALLIKNPPAFENSRLQQSLPRTV